MLRIPVMPLQRHPALAPLSRDHHEALQLAAAVRSPGSRHLRARLPSGPRALAAHVRRVFDEDLAPHFGIEERELMVAVDGLDPELDTMCAEVRRDHDRLRSLIADLASATDESAIIAILDRFGRLLEAHVRFEERTVFKRIQEVLDTQKLAQMTPRLVRAADLRRAL
jgi:hemerythrin-like domain-containing protein